MSNLWDRTKERRLNRIDYARDINARSIYPNNFNASTMISLHTNASPNPAINGMYLYYENKTAEGEKIAKNIICYQLFSKFRGRSRATSHSLARMQKRILPFADRQRFG